ncbi:hypothetical protein JIR001_29790 [Polycladomyces abyssicola]|uniref:ABC-2 transporter permease n=1 Tax=Polycladomyces abyssicola TaxID=1125966 RepID=A0A8D5UIR3_9BACL|nr:ABC-2 transporter permease [Polycladomyces abyssicola]BCU83196.1 hypothetical protein JIR001_29790 [Polycladomyces abyssicola]
MNVWRLIVKDLRVQKYMFLVALFFAFVNMVLTKMNQLVTIVILAYMLITSSIQYDEKQRTSVLLNCLPITRRSFVASKYLSIFLYTLISVVMVFLVNLAALLIARFGFNYNPFTLSLFTMQDVFWALVCIMVLAALFFPIALTFDWNMMQYLLFVVLAVGGTGLFLFANWVKSLDWPLTGSPFALQAAVIVFAALALLYGSYRVSLFLYQKKDF